MNGEVFFDSAKPGSDMSVTSISVLDRNSSTIEWRMVDPQLQEIIDSAIENLCAKRKAKIEEEFGQLLSIGAANNRFKSHNKGSVLNLSSGQT